MVLLRETSAGLHLPMQAQMHGKLTSPLMVMSTQILDPCPFSFQCGAATLEEAMVFGNFSTLPMNSKLMSF